jgi:hypothetical protein
MNFVLIRGRELERTSSWRFPLILGVCCAGFFMVRLPAVTKDSTDIILQTGGNPKEFFAFIWTGAGGLGDVVL